MENWKRDRDNNKETIHDFNKLWHETRDGTWHTSKWLGVKILKNPCDLMIYQELITKLRPALIIETGTCFGGSALFLGTICQAIGAGTVVSIDINLPKSRVKHPRVQFYKGSSVHRRTIDHVKKLVRQYKGHVMVILDSNHKKDHVLKELELYSKFVTKGSYLIVEDTDINKRVRFDHGPGPGDAVDEWLPKNPNFKVDEECEKYFLSFNPGGYLKRCS